jgi:hypothetical protein
VWTATNSPKSSNSRETKPDALLADDKTRMKARDRSMPLMISSP